MVAMTGKQIKLRENTNSYKGNKSSNNKGNHLKRSTRKRTRIKWRKKTISARKKLTKVKKTLDYMAKKSTKKRWNLIRMKVIRNKRDSLKQRRRTSRKAGEETSSKMIRSKQTKVRISLTTNLIISDRFSFRIKSNHKQAKKRQSSRSR